MKRVQRSVGVSVLVATGIVFAFTTWSHASVASVKHACEVGRQRIYRVGIVSEDSSTPGSVLGPTHATMNADSYDTKVSATLTVTDAACEQSEKLQLWNVVQPNISLDATSNGALFSAVLNHDLARPYAVRLDSAGRVLSIAHDPATGELGVALIRRLASAMELVLPDAGSVASDSWRVDEPDVAGVRTSSYTERPWIADRFGIATIALHRTTGVEILPPEQGRFIRHSQTNGVGDDDIRWLADGELQSLVHTYAETTRVASRVVSRVQEMFRVDCLLAPRVDATLDSSVTAYTRVLLASVNAAPLHLADSEHAVDLRGFTNTLGNDTVATVERLIERAPIVTSVRERTPLVDKLSALFYVRPASIDALVPIAQRAPSGATAFLAILQALGRVGTPHAQFGTLLLLKSHGSDASGGTSVVAVLGLTERPIPEIDPILERLSGGTSVTARAAELALGTIAQRIAGTDARRKARLVTRIRHRLQVARTGDRRRLELLALGNASDPSTLDAIEQYARDSDAAVRAGVAMALRHQPSSTADETLWSLLADDRSAVRIAAARAFSERVPSDASYSALRSVARNDKNGTVRSMATDAIWKSRATRGDARGFVAQIALRDSDENVRKYAQGEIATDDSSDEDPDVREPMDYVLAASR